MGMRGERERPCGSDRLRSARVMQAHEEEETVVRVLAARTAVATTVGGLAVRVMCGFALVGEFVFASCVHGVDSSSAQSI